MYKQKPFLKWAGGKYKLASFILEHAPKRKYQRLVEPFVGSAALTMASNFDAYLINDSNADLMNVYRALQEQKTEFVNYAKSFFTTENNQEKNYYCLRELFNHSSHSFERSALFIYLNRHGFNGLCRYNNKGLFNVPFGRYKNPYFPEKEMVAFITKSDRIELMNNDFQVVFECSQTDDLIYCDPPYVPLSLTAYFTSYSQNKFDLDQQQYLAETAEIYNQKGLTILIANHDLPITRKLYAEAEIINIEIRRNIAAKSNSRQKVKELLAIYVGDHFGAD